MKTCIVWFRNDLRLSDQPALAYAIREGYQILPLYMLEEGGQWSLGGASRWWLHHALADLNQQLERYRGKLLLHRCQSDDVVETVLRLVEESGAEAVFWSRRYDAESINKDSTLKKQLSDREIEVKSFSGTLLHEPFKVANLSGNPYKVFTPYWKKCREIPLRQSEAPLLDEAHWNVVVEGAQLDDLALLPTIAWDTAFYQEWTPTRDGAEQLLREMTKGKAGEYNERRDILADTGTSKLSPYLAFGQLSPIEVVEALDAEQAQAYIRQLYWRDFSYYLIYHFPETTHQPLREEWKLFPWEPNEEMAGAWKRGRTGLPVVDAAMRQLWTTGWMHNRARMLVGSVLVKYFQQDWFVGAEWFWDTLVDADLANNTMGWQWVSGCGADAAPYFRVFNPVTQGMKFDPQGEYVRKFVPELAKLSDKYIHCPWDAPSEVLEGAGVVLGETYPKPLIMPKEGREVALSKYKEFKQLSQ